MEDVQGCHGNMFVYMTTNTQQTYVTKLHLISINFCSAMSHYVWRYV